MKFLLRVVVVAGAMIASVSAFAQECAEFPAKIENCTPYTCSFRHPITGQMMQRQIVGVIDGACSYVEQMPNGGKLECRYSEGTRTSVAQFMRTSATATSMGGSVQTGPGGEARVQNTMEGKPIINPLQTALQSGECKISGYGPK